MKRLTTTLLSAALLCSLHAQDEEPEYDYDMPDGKTIPEVQKIDESSVSIGKVIINHKEKSVSFPAVVNMNQGLIEYIVGMPHGKIHETLILTEADPLHVSLGMRMLKFTAFEKFFPMRDGNLEWLPFTPPKPEDYANAYVHIDFTWEQDGAKKSSDLSDMLLNARTRKPFPATDWLYTNSFFYNGRYQASLSGDIIAIFADRTSPINYIGEFNKGDNDSGWVADPEKMPEPGTPITITITQPPSTSNR